MTAAVATVPPVGASRPIFGRWAALGPYAVLLALHVALFLRFYGAFGDLIIDSGREATVPWRILEGQVLYRDFHYEYGPLAPYLFALLYRFFGRHLLVLQSVGLAVSVLTAWLVYDLSAGLMKRPFAFLAALMFTFVFAFQHYFSNNNFNYIFPYTYAAVFGICLLLAVIRAGRGVLEAGGVPRSAAFGALYAFALLTKLETAVVATAVVGATFFFQTFRAGRGALAPVRRSVGAFLAVSAAVLAPVAFYFSSRLDVFSYLRDELLPIWSGSRNAPIFAEFLGVMDLKRNLWTTGWSVVVYAALFAVLFALDCFRARRSGFPCAAWRGWRGEDAGLVPAALALSTGAVWAMGSGNAFLALNLLTLGLAAESGRGLWREWRAGTLSPRTAHFFILSAAALLMLGRKFFKPDAIHYGFYFLVPALILFAATLFERIPAFLARCGSQNRLYYAGVVFFGALVVAVHFRVSLSYYALHAHRLTTPRGTLALYEDRYYAMKGLLEYAENLPREGGSLLVIPEGAMINFLLDRLPVTYYNNALPPFVNTPAKEDAFIGEIEAKKVRWICLTARGTADYGAPVIGRDYLQRGFRHITRNYKAKAVFRAVPFNAEDTFGILLMERKP